ncbi:MAG: extracellular solute-binding protein [Lachnospiraceae bacterium]|nr:extracellular solute-binding protein [Lachnospiraceae bacterium]
MKRKMLALILSVAMTAGMLSGCGNGTDGNTSEGAAAADASGEENEDVSQTAGEEEAPSGEKDVVTALLPPVSATYQEQIMEYVNAFNEENAGVEIQVTTASWEDMTQKLDIQVNAGSPPDIAFIGSDGISKYLDLGMLVDLNDYLSEELSDFDENVLDYFRNGDGTYGLPAYCEVQCIGGNKEKMETAGIDWESVQKNGWTYDEFREAIKKGVVTEGDTTCYGFVFACAGVTAKDYFSIFVKNAGMPASFDKDLKYAYTSKNMLTFLEDVRALIDDGSMPKELSSVDAGKRWNMMLTGQTMITGKGLSSFERSAYNNNKLLEEGSADAVENSIPVEYIVLPVPVFNGEQNAQGAVDGYICLTGEKEPDQAHMQNVARAAYYLASGERAAYTCQELYLSPVCESGRGEYAKLDPIVDKNEANTACVQLLTSQIAEARPDIPAELSAKAIKIEDEVIVPKFQGLLSGEVSPEEMYQAIVEAGHEAFGEEGCVAD